MSFIWLPFSSARSYPVEALQEAAKKPRQHYNQLFPGKSKRGGEFWVVIKEERVKAAHACSPDSSKN